MNQRVEESMHMKRLLVAGLMAGMMTVICTACGSSSGTDADGTAGDTGSGTGTTEAAETAEDSTQNEALEDTSEEPMTVVVAGTPGYEPFTYVGEDGEETGFDIAVMQAIDELAPEITCETAYTEWDSLLPGLDAGRFDVVCGQLSKTDEREQMYTLEQLPLNIAGSSLITTTGHSDWNTMDDLTGATVECIVGSSTAKMVEDYLAGHPDAFEVSYTEAGLAQVIEDIMNGRADATFEDGAVAHSKAKANGYEDRLYVADELYDQVPIFYLMAKNEKGQKIADIIDKYLPELYYNGTLSKLAQEYLGSDRIIQALPEAGYYTEATLEEYQKAHQ